MLQTFMSYISMIRKQTMPLWIHLVIEIIQSQKAERLNIHAMKCLPPSCKYIF